MPNAAGEMRLLHIRKYPIRGSDGTLSHVVCTADDVTRQELTKRELIESRERFRSLVDHIPIALWEEDYSGVKRELEALIQREGIMDIAQYLKSHPETVSALVRKVRILSINAAGLLMYGASDLDEYISSLDEVFSEQSLQMFSRALCAIAAGGTQVSGDDVNFSLDGRRMDVYVTWTVVPGHEETYDQVLVSDLDITSQKDIERMLRQQKEELSAFAHTLAHDMRGPLSSILAHAELARGERPSDDIDAIIRRARELGTLVNATLASALVGFDAQQGSCDNVASIIAGIAEDVVPDTISVNIDEIPPLPMGEVHCRQVFFNLLHNAVVHARPSSIHVKYQHISNMHEIRICDNGRGIAPERIESIFKKGYTTDIDGHGVGLSIVRHIVEQYGGSIVARSRDGRGACFILLLPAK
jgi:signal transduction histidine kinase